MASRSVALAGCIAAACAASTLALAVPARADTGDVVLSEVLFRDGRELLARKDYARACPKLAESFRLDPATGTLLALAVCHEREGKIASAWGEYSDAASRSKVESRPDREAAARAKVQELEPKLSTLTIALPEGVPVAGLEIRRNGLLVAPAWLGTAVPVDGGLVTIDALAPGNRHWQAQVMIASTGDRQTVTIPSFEMAWAIGAAPAAKTAVPVALPPPAPEAPRTAAVAPAAASNALPPPPAPPEAPPMRAPEPPPPAPRPIDSRPAPHGGLTALQWGGVAAGAAGVVGIGVGAAFAFVAMAKNSDSKSLCSTANPDFCSSQGKSDRSAAISAGDIATVGLIAGPVLAATGVTMILLGKRREQSPESAPTSAFIEATPLVGSQFVGGAIRGSF